MHMWLQFPISWGYFFLCRVYIVGMGAPGGVGALLRGVGINNMKVLDFLGIS